MFGIDDAVLAAIIGAGGSLAGGYLAGQGGDNEQTTTYQQNPFSWLNYPPQAGAGASALQQSLFGTPSATPLSFAQWQAQAYPSNPTTNRPDRIARRQQEYSDYLNNFYQGVTYGQSDIQNILYGEGDGGGGISQYYNQFLNEQLPLAMSPYEEFLRSTPAAEWQIIRGDLGQGLNQAQLAQQQYASQYGTAGANKQDWQNMYGDYLAQLAQQRRLLEAGFGERQMAAGTGYANLGLTGTNVASQYANLQFQPYQMQQQYLNSLMGLQGQGGIQMTTSPYIAPNPITQALQGAATGAYIYGQYNQPTTDTGISDQEYWEWINSMYPWK